MPAVTASDGAQLAVHDFGGSGPPLLFVHATGFHGRVWRAVAAGLSSRHRCVAVDLRGHGDSGPDPSRSYHWSGFARDVLAVVDGLGLEDPVGIGHSCGGAALLLAEEARPGTFRSLTLYEPIVRPVDEPEGPSPDNALAAGARRRREEFPDLAAAFENYAGKPPLNVVDRGVLWDYVQGGFTEAAGGVRLKCHRDTEATVFSQSSTHDAFAHLDRVGCPVDLLCGEHTDTFGVDVMEALATRLPTARVRVAAGRGHFGPLEDPAWFADTVGELIASPGQ